MSVVTNIILTHSILEEDAISTVHEWLIRHNKCTLKNIDACSGGNKALECGVWVGAFNHLDTVKFKQVVHQTNWLEPENVRLLIQEQEDDHFQMLLQAAQRNGGNKPHVKNEQVDIDYKGSQYRIQITGPL